MEWVKGMSAPILHYQRERALNDVSAYDCGLQVKTSAGRRIYLARSRTGLALYLDSDLALHYDLEGRLQKIATPNRYRRRSLSHQMLITEKRPREQGGGVVRELLSSATADALVNEAHSLAAPLYDEIRNGTITVEFAKPDAGQALAQISPVLERAARFDLVAAQKDAARFRAIYGRVAVLPPDQYNALVVQVTEGCSYAQCLFCEFYRGIRYRQKTVAEFREHVRALIEYHGSGLKGRRSIFLGEANALALPTPMLVKLFGVLCEHFELPSANLSHVPSAWWCGQPRRFEGISSFLDAFTEPHRSATEYRELSELGLRQVYVGIETGDEDLRRWLRKPADNDAIKRCVAALKEAGIKVGVIVLLGAGGRKFRESHATETVRLLNALGLGKGDFIYYSPMIKGGRYTAEAAAAGMEDLTAEELQEQEKIIRQGLPFAPLSGRPYQARYEMELFTY